MRIEGAHTSTLLSSVLVTRSKHERKIGFIERKPYRRAHNLEHIINFDEIEEEEATPLILEGGMPPYSHC